MLSLLDRQIPYRILFLMERPDGSYNLQRRQLERQQRIPAPAELSEWMKTGGSAPEPIVLDMDAHYESVVCQIAGEAIDALQDERLKERVEIPNSKRS